MGVRKMLNQRPAIGVVAAVGMFVIAGMVLLVWASTRGTPGRVGQVYYSDDDGKTYFADSVDRIYPFDHDGKQAYRAYVYQCGNGQPFIGYLARYNEAAVARLGELKGKESDANVAAEIAQVRATGIDVKRPGDAQWTPLFGAAGEAIAQHPICPDGSTAKLISPPESGSNTAPAVAGDAPPLRLDPAATGAATAPAGEEPPASQPAE